MNVLLKGTSESGGWILLNKRLKQRHSHFPHTAYIVFSWSKLPGVCLYMCSLHRCFFVLFFSICWNVHSAFIRLSLPLIFHRMHKLIKPSVDRRYVDLTVSFAPEADGDEDLPGPPVRYYFSPDGETPWHLPQCHPQASCVLISLLLCKLLHPNCFGMGQEFSLRMLPDKVKTPCLSTNPSCTSWSKKSQSWSQFRFCFFVVVFPCCLRSSQWNTRSSTYNYTCVHILCSFFLFFFFTLVKCTALVVSMP